MKIFITGGTGFIGRHLKEQLAGKYQVAAPPRSEINLLDAEKVKGYLQENHFDVVIHAATWNATRNSTKDLTKVQEFNLKMFDNLVRCDGEYGKLICFSSGADFDRRYWVPKMKEEYFGAHVPEDAYGLSKYRITQKAEQTRNVLSLRLFAVFGKYEDWEIRFISNACCKAVWDLPITLKKNVFFDYLYVDDLVRITDWFIQNRPRKNSYNVCTGETHDLLTLAKKVLKVSGKNLEIKVAQPGLDREYSGDNSRLIGEIGPFSFTGMDCGIAALYRWYQKHKNEINRELLLKDK